MALGEEIGAGYSFQTPTQSYLDRTDSVIAGSYLALGIVGTNQSDKMLAGLQTAAAKASSALNSEDSSAISSLKREDVQGIIFASGVIGYYAQYNGYATLQAKNRNIQYLLAPTAGTYGYEPYQRTLFGLNRGIENGGTYMNVRIAQQARANNGNLQETKNLIESEGYLSSALEHGVPEQLWADASNPPNAISAVKALQIAASQGQRIYTITSVNAAVALPQMSHNQAAMLEIQQAIASGKKVVTHTASVSVPGWTGSGYIITDQTTGEGVYKISGGKNGGYLDAADKTLLVSNLMVDWYVDLAEWGSKNIMKQMEPVINCMKSISNFLGLASLGVQLTQAIIKCQDHVDELLSIVIPGLCALFAIGVLATMLGSLGGPLLAIIVNTAQSIIVGILGDMLINSVCTKIMRKMRIL
jgi:hypothetical protein